LADLEAALRGIGQVVRFPVYGDDQRFSLDRVIAFHEYGSGFIRIHQQKINTRLLQQGGIQNNAFLKAAGTGHQNFIHLLDFVAGFHEVFVGADFFGHKIQEQLSLLFGQGLILCKFHHE
jgi:hypothetical protein